MPANRMTQRLSLALLAASLGAVLLAACTEPDKEAGSATPTPTSSPTPVVTPIPLAFPGEFVGRIAAAGEQDVYSFVISATSGSLVELDVDAEVRVVSSSFNGQAIDARLTIYGPSGNLIKVLDDGTTFNLPASPSMKDPFVVFDAAGQPGLYLVSVENANGTGGAVGFDYVLRSSRSVPIVKPGGDSCGTAVLLTNFEAAYSGVVSAAATNSVGDSNTALGCVKSIVDGKDHVYRALLTSGMKLQAVRTGALWDGAFYVTTACDVPTIYAEIDAACVSGGDGSEDADGVVFTAAVTGTHYFFVDGVVTNSSGPYRLDLRTFNAGE